mmetsp:Transcript_42929/g.78015  ORF Transcript_42929/g.78015 Transcript_42929/m.78015 type:complete len:219 (+) Transcript_42929:58-714(+)
MPMPALARRFPMKFGRCSRSQRRSALVPCMLAVICACSCMQLAFLPSARSAASRQDSRLPATFESSSAAVAGVISAGMLAPSAVLADLPPLDDLPIEGLRGAPVTGFVLETEMWTVPFVGVTLPVLVYGGVPLFIIPPIVAATWAWIWVNLVPSSKGDYVTYLGIGGAPPPGFANNWGEETTNDGTVVIQESFKSEAEKSDKPEKKKKKKSDNDSVVL